MTLVDMIQKILQCRILVVDDQEANARLMERLLTREGYRNITLLTDSRKVREAQAREPFDLILLDIRMPHLDGFGVMGELKAMGGDDYLPVLVMTAQTDTETKLKALAQGAKDFLYKPFDKAEALSRIHNLLEVRVMHTQIRDQNRILEEQVLQRTAQLRQSQLEVVRRLGRAAEYRDNETGMHVVRMSKASAALGRAMGMDEGQCELILNTAPMHDVGKIGIPDHILLKGGKLTPHEWEVMQTHTVIGADLLGREPSQLLETASLIALTHHEKWDGSGYPQGLKGEAIPLFSRIIAVCDVYDALTSTRPYKNPWSAAEALAEIISRSGTHFDPRVVAHFEQIFDEIQAISRENADPR
ncbi:MAG: response regulator [Deltaproteobacteria bacterium]|nr:response regulator [Deltaproteobacteria bacterium]